MGSAWEYYVVFLQISDFLLQWLVCTLHLSMSTGMHLKGLSRYVWNRAHYFPFFALWKTHAIPPLRFIKQISLYLAWGKPGTVSGIIWYDMIWYDMIWYDDMMWYDMIWYVCGNRWHCCCCWTRRMGLSYVVYPAQHTHTATTTPRVLVSLCHVHLRRKGLQEAENRRQRVSPS